MSTEAIDRPTATAATQHGDAAKLQQAGLSGVDLRRVWSVPVTALAFVLAACVGGTNVDTDADADTDSDSDSDTDTDTDTDRDDDGRTRLDDCDDTDPTIYRGAPDAAGDGVDANCDGVDSDRAVAGSDIAVARLLGDGEVGGIGNNAGRRLLLLADATSDDLSDILVAGPAEIVKEVPVAAPRLWLIPGDARGEGLLGDRAVARWSLDRATPLPSLGSFVAEAGDLDGDGRSDVVMGAPLLHSDTGSYAVTYSSAEGGERSCDAWIFALNGGYSVGDGVAGEIDIDGDGMADVAATYQDEDYVDPRTLFVRSPAAGVLTPADADQSVPGVVYPLAGGSADVDGDGYDDTLVYNDPADPGHIRLLPGPLVDLEPGATLLTLGVADGSNVSFSIGDINGDGLADLAYGVAGYDSAGPNSGQAAFFLGPLQGARAYADADATLDAEASQIGLARALSIAGDLDGDGDDEIAVGLPGVYAAVTGAVALFWDPWSGGRTTADADIVLTGAELGGEFGYALATDGDVDGDGRADLVVGAWGEAELAGAVYVFAGSDLGIP